MHQLPVLNLNWYFVHDCMLLWQFLMVFLKALMWKVLTTYKIVIWYRFRQNENGKLLRCEFSALLPLKFILASFVKRFIKQFCIKSSLFCNFSDWKHVRTIATCQKKTFHQENSVKPCFATSEKSGHSRMILSPIPYFCDKSKRYLDLNQYSSRETCFLPIG